MIELNLHVLPSFLFQFSYLSNRVFDNLYLVNNMSHLLKLAEEYNVEGVLDLCVKCLKDVPKSEENVVKLLYLATDTLKANEDSRLDDVRNHCELLLKNMDLANITGKSDFKNLNRDSLEKVFVKRTERLERFIKDVRPQLIGLVEYCLYLKLESSQFPVIRCPQHFALPVTAKFAFYRPAHVGLLQRISSCLGCKEMIKQLVSSSYKLVETQTQTQKDTSESLFAKSGPKRFVKEHMYRGSFHFDEKLITVLQDLNEIVYIPEASSGTSTTSHSGFLLGASNPILPGSFISAGTTTTGLPGSFSSGTSAFSLGASTTGLPSSLGSRISGFNFGVSTSSLPGSSSSKTSTTGLLGSFSSGTSTIGLSGSLSLGATASSFWTSTTSLPGSFSSKTSTTGHPGSFSSGTLATTTPSSVSSETSATTLSSSFSSGTATASLHSSFSLGTLTTSLPGPLLATSTSTS